MDRQSNGAAWMITTPSAATCDDFDQGDPCLPGTFNDEQFQHCCACGGGTNRQHFNPITSVHKAAKIPRLATAYPWGTNNKAATWPSLWEFWQDVCMSQFDKTEPAIVLPSGASTWKEEWSKLTSDDTQVWMGQIEKFVVNYNNMV